jgi:formate dehydrogenase accessory protein FdhE
MRTNSTTDPLTQRLRRLAQTSPALASTARMYESFLPLLRDADLDVAPIHVTPRQIQEKLQQGIPLLMDVDLDIDAGSARELMLKLAEAMAGSGKKGSGFPFRLPWSRPAADDHSEALKIKTAVEKNTIDAGHLLSLIAAGDHNTVSAAAAERGLDAGLVLAMARNTLKPALRTWCRQLVPLAKEVEWQSAVCFVCGAPAMLAELQGNDQARHLRCGMCGSDWQVRRLQCAQCGNEDHRTLQNFMKDGEEDRMRVEACDNCRGYIKVIASFSPTPFEELAVADLETLYLDHAAQGLGYSRLSASPARTVPALYDGTDG